MKKILLFAITTLIFVPSVTLAQKYLVDLPIENKDNFGEYINMLYKMSISVAALLAVVKIIVAGAKYMLNDIVTKKSEAKDDIKGALLGLLLIIGAVIILNTINPALSNGGLNITKLKVPELNITAPVRTVDGQTANEKADALIAAAGDPCATKGGTLNNDTGTKSVVITNVSTCANKADVINKIKAECLKTSGATIKIAADEAWINCATPKQSAVNASKFVTGVKAILNDNLEQFLGQSENVITYDVNKSCVELAKAKAADAQSDFLSDCKESYNSTSVTENPLGGLCVSEQTLGKYDYDSNTGIATCKLPKLVLTREDFKGYNPELPDAIPTGEAEFKAACQTKIQGAEAVQDAVTSVLYWNSSGNDRCVLY